MRTLGRRGLFAERSGMNGPRGSGRTPPPPLWAVPLPLAGEVCPGIGSLAISPTNQSLSRYGTGVGSAVGAHIVRQPCRNCGEDPAWSCLPAAILSVRTESMQRHARAELSGGQRLFFRYLRSYASEMASFQGKIPNLSPLPGPAPHSNGSRSVLLDNPPCKPVGS